MSDRPLPQRGGLPRPLRASGADLDGAPRDALRAPELRRGLPHALPDLRRSGPRGATRRTSRVVDLCSGSRTRSASTLFGKKLPSLSLAKAYARALLLGPLAPLPAPDPEKFDRRHAQGRRASRASKQMTRDHPHGLLLPPGTRATTSLAPKRVLTEGQGAWISRPTPVVEAFEARHAEDLYRRGARQSRDRLKLIGIRQIKRMNTASSNNPAARSGDRRTSPIVCPEDAQRGSVSTNGEVRRRAIRPRQDPHPGPHQPTR